jgi:hypothetical protein
MRYEKAVKASMRSAAALALLLSAQAQAQDQSADPFDAAAFDQASGGGTAASSSEGSAARTEYLVGGTMLVSASAYIPSGFDGYAASGSASGKLFGKVTVPDYGTLYMSYNLSQALFAGLAGEGRPELAPPRDLFAPSWSPGEAYYGFDIGKAVFLRLGKQLLAWGPSRVWTPVDFINLQKADAFSSVDLRQGKPGLKLHVPLGKANAFVFADFSRVVDSSQPMPVVRDPLGAGSLAARLDATIGGFELGLTGFGGAEVQAKAGFDFSGDFFGSGVYGELGLAPAYSGYKGSVLASLGFSRALGELKRWTVSAEGFYNSLGAEYSGPALAAGLQAGLLAPLYIGKAYGYAAVSAKELFSSDLATTLSGLANFTDGSFTIKLAEDFSLPRALPFTLSLSYSGGGAGKELTALGGDNSLSLSAQTLIEF